MRKFEVVKSEREFPSRQIAYDVVRNDGAIVRSGMWPEFADADCELLNECFDNGWTSDKYHAERKIRMAAVRQ